jgi:cold shock CspA family protein
VNPIISGMVIAAYDDSSYGFISPDRACNLGGHAMFRYEDVVNGQQLVRQDRVELEVEKTPKGWKAVWVKYTGHGPISPEPEELVEGEGVVKGIYQTQTDIIGRIRPDVRDAPDVMFTITRAYEGCRVGDRVSFIARESNPGKWRARSVRKMNSPEPTPPPVRDWRDSWKEDAK